MLAYPADFAAYEHPRNKQKGACRHIECPDDTGDDLVLNPNDNKCVIVVDCDDDNCKSTGSDWARTGCYRARYDHSPVLCIECEATYFLSLKSDICYQDQTCENDDANGWLTRVKGKFDVNCDGYVWDKKEDMLHNELYPRTL